MRGTNDDGTADDGRKAEAARGAGDGARPPDGTAGTETAGRPAEAPAEPPSPFPDAGEHEEEDIWVPDEDGYGAD